jgi:lysozyme
VLLAAVALAAVLAVATWWYLAHWHPDPARYPSQGVEVGADDGVVDWRGVRAVGGSFAYLDASASAFARDPAFTRNLADARAAGLRVGAVHRYDPCQPADRQAANFMTLVPRDAALLPPAVDLSATADDCPVHVTDGMVESELTTFLNQIETHTGKPAVLKLSPTFERRYEVAARFERPLWLTRDRLQPGYAERPWRLWTANAALRTEVAEKPLRWIVRR